MRALIGLLMALNLGMFLVGMVLQRWLPEETPAVVFNAEKIRLLALPSAVLPVQPVAPPGSPALPEVVATEPPVTRCMVWPRLDPAGLRAVEAHLSEAGISSGDYAINLEQKLGWWVFLPPLDSEAAAQAMIEEIMRLGIKDYALVRGGAMRNAISLGAFASLAKAREHAAGLSAKGVEQVQFGPRPESGAARLILSETLAEARIVKLPAWPKGLQPARCENQP